MQGVVNERGASQRGTPKLKIDGTWYVASKLNLDGIESGSRVEFEPSTFPGQNGPVKCINSIRPVQASGGGGAPAKVANAVSDDATMRFISNIVGSAVTAKTITEPAQIAAWYQAAKMAATAPALPVRRPPSDDEPPPFNDEIPY
jgi:hypothetical protein